MNKQQLLIHWLNNWRMLDLPPDREIATGSRLSKYARHFSGMGSMGRGPLKILNPTISWSVMLCYVMLCYVMLCYVMLWYVMLYFIMLFMLSYVMSCYVLLCCVMLCYVMLCYVMLCYVMLCYVTIHKFDKHGTSWLLRVRWCHQSVAHESVM